MDPIEPAKIRRQLGLGYVLPRLLLLFLAIDITLRIVDVQWPILKPKDAVPHSDVPGQPFQPNVQLRIPKVYGNLAVMSNLLDESEARPTQFSTDARGFRNTGMAGKVRALWFGDSFSWSGESDETTLPARIGKQLACHIGNAAGPDQEFRRPQISRIEAIANGVGMTGGLVIVAEVEERSFETFRERSRSQLRRETAWARIAEFFRKLFRSSPIKRYAENQLRPLFDDRLLPNIYKSNVVSGNLRNGQTMLFLPNDLRPPSKALPFPAKYWQTLDLALKKQQRQLLVAIVPNKYTVYRDLLAEPDKLPDHGEIVTDRVETGLKSLNIPVVNLTRILKTQAQARLEGGEYVYWRNDTHWNPAGVKIAADAIIQAFPELRRACR